jgi:isopentenyl-diphosphate delta-isomerase
METQERKLDHVRITLAEDVQSGITSGLERYRFVHQALPELDLADVNLECTFLGRQLRVPLLISSMTGGATDLEQVNRRLAEAASSCRIAMGVGSQRAALESPATAFTFQVRKWAPDVLLLANLGAVQLNYGLGPDDCRRAVDMIGADALVLHLNPLQEALQPGGDTDWTGLLAKIAGVVRQLDVPLIVKEVGWGISADVACALVDAGVAAIDIAGAGGTSWSEVERHRATTRVAAEVAAHFKDWGISTADSLRQVRDVAPGLPIIASGGLRNGVDLAKCIALGARLGGLASPFLRAAQESTEAVIAAIEELATTLRVVMFCIGTPDLAALAVTPHLVPTQGAQYAAP